MQAYGKALVISMLHKLMEVFMVKQNLFRWLLASFFFLIASLAEGASIDALLHRANDPILGDREGAITVVEFFDYQCGHCENMAPVILRIINANPNVRFVFKEYPILGGASRLLARAAIAASYQNKYEEFTKALYDTKNKSKDSILKIAESLNLDVKKLQQDMQSRKVTKLLKDNIKLAKELNVSGTPSFFIGKTNATSTSDLKYFLGELKETELQSEITKAST
jgi:protein-disulfide isomerase